MSLNLFRRLDRYDRRIRQLERTEGEGGGGEPGPEGPEGPAGPEGPQGDPGEGVPAGGTAGQVLTKDTGTDYDTSWQTGAAHADSDHDDRFAQLAHTHAPGAWQTPSFATGWANFGGIYQTVRYRLEGDVVRLDGVAKRTSGTGVIIFTLNSGWRPVANHWFPVTMTGNATGRVEVESNGEITIQGGDPSGSYTLSGITFPTT